MNQSDDSAGADHVSATDYMNCCMAKMRTIDRLEDEMLGIKEQAMILQNEMLKLKEKRIALDSTNDKMKHQIQASKDEIEQCWN